jgi:hypothetical protein
LRRRRRAGSASSGVPPGGAAVSFPVRPRRRARPAGRLRQPGLRPLPAADHPRPPPCLRSGCGLEPPLAARGFSPEEPGREADPRCTAS